MRLRVNNLILLMFVIAPFFGIFKMLLGVGYAPIVIDFLSFTLLLFFLYQRGIPSNVYAVTLLLFLCLGVLLLFVPYDASLGFKLQGFRSSVYYMIFALLPFYQRIDDRFIEKFVKVNLVTGIVVCIYAIRQYFYPLDFELAYSMLEGVGSHFYGDTYQREEGRFRIFGPMITSTHLGSYALFVFFLSCSSINSNTIGKSLIVSSICLSLIVLLITYSRTSLIGFFAGLVFFMFCLLKISKGREILHRGLSLIVLGVVAGAVVMLLMHNVPMLAERFGTLSNIGEISSFQSRLTIWDFRLKQIGANWLGYGTGIAGFHGGSITIMPVDNQFLKMFIEMGWFGGVAFIVILMMPFSIWNRLSKYSSNAIFVGGGLAFIFAVIVIMGASQILEGFPTAMFFWYMSGLLIVLKKQNAGKYILAKKIGLQRPVGLYET